MVSAEDKLSCYLTDNKPLEDLSETAEQMGYSCWLVGGALRDILLGRPITDVDLVTELDPTPLARHWAKQQEAHWFWLDKERRQSRVLLRYGKLDFYFDFAPLRAETLAQDLTLRDFTINALALPLVSPLTDQTLIDPLCGRKDLLASRLRLCSEQSLHDDPLRILKGVRHAVTLGLQIVEKTESLMLQSAELLAAVAAERKRNELGRIFSSGNLEVGLTLLDKCHLLPALFGKSTENFSVADVNNGLIALEDSLNQWSGRAVLADLLEEAYDETINRRTLYLLALFLRNYRCRDPETVMTENLRFSKRSATILLQLVRLDFNRLAFLQTGTASTRVTNVCLESLGSTAIDQLIFFAFVEQPTYLPVALLEDILSAYSIALTHGRIPDLMTGSEVKQLLPEIADKQIGLIQKRIKQAEITEEISSKKEASALILAENSIDNH